MSATSKGLTPDNRVQEKGDQFQAKFSTLDDAIIAVEEIIKVLDEIDRYDDEFTDSFKKEQNEVLNYLKSKL